MLKIAIWNGRQQLSTIHEDGPIEFGRGPKREAERIVINDKHVSRDHLRVEERPGGSVRLENISSTSEVDLENHERIAPGGMATAALPIRVVLGRTMLDLSPIASEPRAENDATIATQRLPGPKGRVPFLADVGDVFFALRLARWFETLLEVQLAAAGTDRFYEGAARAVVDLIGLDRGTVLLKHGDDWIPVAAHTARSRPELPFSRTVVQNVLEQRRMLFECPTANAQEPASLQQLEAVVAAPFFDRGGEILGIVYGSRDARGGAQKHVIQPLEAQVVQLLAAIVGTGLMRLCREIEAVTLRTRFEQFCSRELAEELTRRPDLLKGADREVTILFVDLRNSSKFAESLETDLVYRVMGDIMDRLTECVFGTGGIIVDYYGDGLCAMWNAPTPQPDHADRACRAALAMVACLPELNDRWAGKVGTRLDLGVGINTGVSQVGNAGSYHRVKYGPRGHAVNLASRVEGATKKFGVRILVTDATRRQLQSPLDLRRIGKAYLAGVEQAVELFERPPNAAYEQWCGCRKTYEQALSLFEQGQFLKAAAALDALPMDGSVLRDGPARQLLKQIAAHAQAPAEKFDPGFRFDAK